MRRWGIISSAFEEMNERILGVKADTMETSASLFTWQDAVKENLIA